MGEEGIIYLSLHCHHQNDSCIKMVSDESHFNVSSVVRDKVTRQCLQTTTFEEKREPKRIRTEVPLLTSLTPYRKAKPAHNIIDLNLQLDKTHAGSQNESVAERAQITNPGDTPLSHPPSPNRSMQNSRQVQEISNPRPPPPTSTHTHKHT